MTPKQKIGYLLGGIKNPKLAAAVAFIHGSPAHCENFEAAASYISDTAQRTAGMKRETSWRTAA